MNSFGESDVAGALAPMVGLRRRLLDLHVEDAGGRCATCRWQTRTADRWPCRVQLLAAEAQRRDLLRRIERSEPFDPGRRR